MALLLKQAHIPGRMGLWDVRIDGEAIQEVSQDITDPGAQVHHLEGRVLSPAFADIHTHLDKAYTYDLLPPNKSGTLGEAIDNFLGAVSRFSEDDFYLHGKKMLDNALVNGTLYLRSHITISDEIGLRALKAAVRLKQDYARLMDVQVVAFPGDEPEGISPAMQKMTREAFRCGADILGGTPNRYCNERQFIDDLFVIAREVGCDMDLHVDEKDEPVAQALEYYADRAAALGYCGRVTAGHCCSLSAVDEETAARITGKIMHSGMHIVTLPSCNLYLMGREDVGLVRRGTTRARQLLDAGVNVCISSDNIRDVFRPFGNADMLEETLLAAQVFRMDTPALLAQALDMATYHPARAMGIRGYGLTPGDRANLVVLDAPDIAAAVLSQCAKHMVISRGRIIARTRTTVETSWD